MKHRILIEFSADKLPDDFLDQIAGRVYGHFAVDKKECTASFVGDVLKDAERWRKIRDLLSFEDIERLYADRFGTPDEEESKKTDAAIDAAKGTQ